MINHVVLSAQVLECEPLRHTPAGQPVLEMLLTHQSTAIEAMHKRQVSLTISALAIGDLANMLATIQLGSALHIEGFLASARKDSVKLKLHIQKVRVETVGHDPLAA